MNSSSIRELLEQRAAEAPGCDFVLSPETGGSLGFQNVLDGSRGLAWRLAREGFTPGQRIGLLMANGPEAAALFLGLMATGYVVTPLSLIAGAGQLAYVLAHSGCVAVFVSAEEELRLRAALVDVPQDIRVFSVPENDGERCPDQAPAGWPGRAPAAEAPALLMYTSGTTGRPKGVLLSHANVLAGARFVSEAHSLTTADRVLAVLPLYHINAQIVTLLAPLLHGGSLVVPRRFSASAFWEQAAEYRCTWLNVVPTMIAYLLAGEVSASRFDRSRLRFCRCASAPLPPEHHRAFEARFGIGVVETMGLTETAGPILSNPLDPALRKVGSPGLAWGNEARVADPASGAPLADGLRGEIQVRGPNVMGGYFQDAGATAAAFTPGGWLRTGDLGYRDDEGYFFVTGRLKEIIIKGGENIAPREIDEALLCHPEVLEAAAFGVPHPAYDQDIEAGVVLRPGATTSEPDLVAHCRTVLGAFKTPTRIRFLAELPKGPSGKVQRLRLAGRH